MKQRSEFRKSVIRDGERQKKARQHRGGLFGLLFYGGTLGLLLAVPIVGGAYLGRWLDALSEGFSTRWTVSFIVLGVLTGIWNVYWYLRDHL